MEMRSPPRTRPTTLDGWYVMVNGIYYDRNFYRDAESLMCHLVEVIGALSVVASRKVRHEGDPELWVDRFMAKSLGWWMVLCGKVGIKSVADLLWTKFPRVCTYCHRDQHSQAACAEKRAARSNPDWDDLRRLGDRNIERKPASLGEWRRMYAEIYPRSEQTSQEANFARLTEELGELAEAVRVLPVTRSYFLSEAADVFAWLMGVANQLHSLDYLKPSPQRRWHSEEEHLDTIMWSEYPGACGYCLGASCKCPPIPSETMNRIAKEGPPTEARTGLTLFSVSDAREFFRLGEDVLVHGRSVRLEDVRGDIAKLTIAVRAAASTLAGESDDLRRRIDEVGVRLETAQETSGRTQILVDEAVRALQALPAPAVSRLEQVLLNLNSGLIVEFLKAAVAGR